MTRTSNLSDSETCLDFLSTSGVLCLRPAPVPARNRALRLKQLVGLVLYSGAELGSRGSIITLMSLFRQSLDIHSNMHYTYMNHPFLSLFS